MTTVSSETEFVKLLDLLEKLNNLNPLFSKQFGTPMKIICLQVLNLTKKVQIQLNDLVRFSKLQMVGNENPTFLFPEMLKSNQSFATEVFPETLNKFVDEIVYRANLDQFIFDHLQISKSKIHKNLKPYNEVTFVLID